MTPESFRESPWLPQLKISGYAGRPQMGQPEVMSREEQEAVLLVEEARRQLLQVQRNFPSLVAAIGQDGAQRALVQANLSVDLYEEQLKNARMLSQ